MPRLVIPFLFLILTAGFTTAATASEPPSAGEQARLVAAEQAGRLAPGLAMALARGETMPVIVRFASPAGEAEPARRGAALLARVPASERSGERLFTTVPGMALSLSARGLAALLAEPEVLRVDPDAGGGALLAETVPLAGGAALQMAGWTGAGSVVALLDSGIDAAHPDLAGALDGEACFCTTADGAGCCPGGGTTRTGPGSAADDFGHGTHLAGIITGDGHVAPVGMAPEARLVAVKVLDATGAFAFSSDIVAALDWITAHRPDVDVVSLSLGTGALFPGVCDDATAYTQLLAAAVANLRARGVLVLAASGNRGSGTALPAPACLREVIAVGATWDADVGYQGTMCLPPPDGPGPDPVTAPGQITCFSNTNAEVALVAPGAPITSTRLGGGTTTLYGTSLAAAVASGCAALLREAAPLASPELLASALATSATRPTDRKNGRSFPLLDCVRALAVAQSANTAPCTRGATTACLLGGRFEVTVGWLSDGHATGEAKVMAFGGQRTESDQSVFFYFFDDQPENFEMGVKVLDGCPINGQYWVFISGLTNRGYTVRVRDSVTGRIRTYANPLGNYPQTVGDTDALPCS
ncbi:MAG: S8 family serine peptidase [Acidobacteria bacterium]|nr:S8 family serine peptidase [Thermoanaerobaculia bacterium]NLN11577.1 S8 family serine peptidase [Acidobacteriota bacterium]MBP7812846.1 S8 family serine peptidase [Thermoanaerobaculia bacterium]MBP8845846.1 S8 family serine peptidase [Thermoanaerobaculia bacterium]HPA96583.1 S8 family serine peptidase [Thermoanaerobaculia bacterium]